MFYGFSFFSHSDCFSLSIDFFSSVSLALSFALTVRLLPLFLKNIMLKMKSFFSATLALVMDCQSLSQSTPNSVGCLWMRQLHMPPWLQTVSSLTSWSPLVSLLTTLSLKVLIYITPESICLSDVSEVCQWH